MLKIPPTDKLSEMTTAYRRLVRVFRPDKLTNKQLLLTIQVKKE